MERLAARRHGEKVTLELGFESTLDSVYIEYTPETEQCALILRAALEENGAEVLENKIPTYTMLFCFPSRKTKGSLRMTCLKALSLTGQSNVIKGE